MNCFAASETYCDASFDGIPSRARCRVVLLKLLAEPAPRFVGK